MSAVYALYRGCRRGAARGERAARRRRRRRTRVIVIVGEPIEDQPFAHRDSATWMWYIACLGGLVGLVFATWLTRMTELAWPLQTGNMPIVAWWPNLIVMFELTMLGAILATVLTLFVTAKLPGRLPKLYDPEVTDGQDPRRRAEPPAAAAALEQALLAGGAAELKRS